MFDNMLTHNPSPLRTRVASGVCHQPNPCPDLGDREALLVIGMLICAGVSGVCHCVINTPDDLTNSMCPPCQLEA